MDEIVIQDETDAHLLSYVIFFFLFVASILCAGIAKHGFSIGYNISIGLVSLSGIFIFLYYKNHSCFLRIDATGISMQETIAFTKGLRTKWHYDYKDNTQIILTDARTSIGSRGNRTDCIHVIVVRTPFQSEKKKLVARLDSNTKSRIHSLAVKHDLNLIVG